MVTGAVAEQGAVIAQGLRYVNAWKGKTVVVLIGMACDNQRL